MEKRYTLEGLDCPNCAMKIEKALNKRKEVKEASVNAATLKCVIDYEEYSHETEKEMIDLIEDLEEVKVIADDHASKKEHPHSHEHHHDHDHACCHSDKPHEHHERPMPMGDDMMKVKWQIEGLDCANCALKVEDAVNEVAGVDFASLNFTTKALIFYINKTADKNTVIKDVQKAILDVEQVEIMTGDEAEQKEKKDIKYYLIGAGIIALLFGIVLDNRFVMITAYLLIGYSVILKAFKNIRRKEIFDENFLMVLATLGAIAVGEDIEAVAVMLFYQVGEYFQNRSVEKSRKSIADLMNIKAEVAHVLEKGEVFDRKPESVHINDMIQILPGERIPLDGQIIEGTSQLDTSALTGESMPVEAKENEEVFAGYINLSGLLKVKVTKTSDESTVSRILDLVENASAKKAQTELKMTRFARVYTPIVVIAALLLAVLPNFFNTGIEWQQWLLRACTFLVISCPCALVLSIPLGYFAGIGSASKKGILVKGGNYLEILNEVDTIVFDKTGTLTSGTFTVSNIEADDQEECLKLAALAESYSTHPIAQSILSAYGRKIDENEVSHIEEVAGHGMKAEVQGKLLLVGNMKLMQMFDIECSKKNTAGTLVYVAYDGQLKGTIEISDTLKTNTVAALKELKEKGIKKLVMLTGDRKETALQIAKQCSLDEVHYELLPDQKVDELEKIMRSSHKVAYVGDGINDAPVLARSDLGIAMGGLGSEAAVEASDIVLMKDDLSALPKGIELAKMTQKIMNENIAFILLIKLLILVLSIFGYANMWMGVFADVGVSVLAVLNSMRLLAK